MLRRRVVPVLLSFVLVGTTAACGDDDDSAVQPAILQLTYEGTTDTAALAAAVTDRLEAIGIVVEAIDTDTPGAIEVALEDERLDELATELLSSQGLLRARPVLAASEGESPDFPVTVPGTEVADQQATLPQAAEDGSVAFMLRMGPAVVDAGAIETATVLEGDNGLELQLTLVQAAMSELNTAAALCFAKAETCPTGQLAFTVDGRVIAAPIVEQPSFTADELVIVPQLDELAIRRLATVLSADPLPVALVPVLD